MSKELTTRQPDAVISIDKTAVLKALGVDPADPKAQALILTCSKYGLDPVLKHALLISGSLYITRDGLLHVAHSSGQFDGISVGTVTETNTHFVATATVWRKDMTHPFIYTGRYPKNGRLSSYGPEMAEKVAECRALRRAFSVSLCSQEELWDNEPAEARPAQNPPHNLATKNQQAPARALPSAPAPKAGPPPAAAPPGSRRPVETVNPIKLAREKFRRVANELFTIDNEAGLTKLCYDLVYPQGGGPKFPSVEDYQSAIQILEERISEEMEFAGSSEEDLSEPVGEPVPDALFTEDETATEHPNAIMGGL